MERSLELRFLSGTQDAHENAPQKIDILVSVSVCYSPKRNKSHSAIGIPVALWESP